MIKKERKMELTISISKDEEQFTKDEFGLFLAKKGFMKRLIEIEMAEKLAAQSHLTDHAVDELSKSVKESLYRKIKSS
jgi:hypothetical protein